MACEVTPAAIGSQVLEFQPSSIRVPLNDADVEVDEVGVVGPIALRGANSMGIVADGTGRIFLYDVPVVHSGRSVGEENISIVALVTQCV
jgi:hypothetical protein